MFPWRDQSICPIGVDIGTHGVRLLQLRRKGDKLDLIAAARTDVAPLDPQTPQIYHDAVVAALRAMQRSHKFLGQECISALPAQRVVCKSLRMPQMPESDVEQALRWEAKDRLGFDVADGPLAFFRAGEVRRGTETKDEFLIFAATAETITGHLQQLTEAGLRVGAIDLQPCAMFRALQRLVPATEGAVALVDLGPTATQFLVTQDDRLAFYKNIEIGDAALNTAVGQKLGVPVAEAAQLRQRLAQRDTSEAADTAEAPLEQAVFDAMRPLLEELAKELDLCLRYYGVTFRGTRPEIVHGIGGQAYGPRSMELISSALGSRIEIVQPLCGVGNLGQYARPDRSTEWALVTGLSLYPLSPRRAGVAA